MYDTTIGRFLSEDPLGHRPQENNLYLYVNNSPVMKVDPSGLDPDMTSGEFIELLLKTTEGDYVILFKNRKPLILPKTTTTDAVQKIWMDDLKNILHIMRREGDTFRFVNFGPSDTLSIDEKTGMYSFVAGVNDPNGPHTVTFGWNDHAFCDTLLSGAVVGGLQKNSVLDIMFGTAKPCAGDLLWNFLTGQKTVPESCKSTLSKFLIDQPFEENWLMQQISKLSKEKLSCDTSGTISVEGFYDDVEMFKKGFTSKGEQLDKDLFGAFGKFNEVHIKADVDYQCGPQKTDPESGQPCCECTVRFKGRIGLSDTYDFISTLPKPSKAWKAAGGWGNRMYNDSTYTAFYCAAILEALGEQGRVYEIAFSLDLPETSFSFMNCDPKPQAGLCDELPSNIV